jgi:HlyD family secretion protein
MKRWIGIIAIAVLFAAGGTAWYYLEAGEPAPGYRLAKVERGEIVSTVSATGTVNPVTTVQVGSQLSGQIKELYADFNTRVKAEQPLARLDTDTIEARRLQAVADLDSARAAQAMQAAQVEKVRADLLNAEAALAVAQAQAQRAELLSQDAERENGRKQQLTRQGYTTQADGEKAKTALDTARSDVIQTRAQVQAVSAQLAAMHASLRIAEAQVATAAAQAAQREAMLQQVKLDLDHATIRAPIDGVVVQRSVDLGQTVAASLQSPTLFNIAKDLRVMQVETSIDEGDIGRIAEGQPATFTVTAFPADTFEGRVAQIRLGPQIVQNVVTYVVVIAAENPDMKLLPGMTATVRVVTDQRANALKVPNAALRFRPPGAPTQGPPGQPAGGGPAHRRGSRKPRQDPDRRAEAHAGPAARHRGDRRRDTREICRARAGRRRQFGADRARPVPAQRDERAHHDAADPGAAAAVRRDPRQSRRRRQRPDLDDGRDRHIARYARAARHRRWDVHRDRAGRQRGGRPDRGGRHHAPTNCRGRRATAVAAAGILAR